MNVRLRGRRLETLLTSLATSLATSRRPVPVIGDGVASCDPPPERCWPLFTDAPAVVDLERIYAAAGTRTPRDPGVPAGRGTRAD